MLKRCVLVVPPVAALGAAGSALAQAPELDPGIERLRSEISEARLEALDEKLQRFGTRNTLSRQDSVVEVIRAPGGCR
jgi:hypothetical protein